MEFQNAGIDIDRIPKAADLALQPVDPRYLKVLWRQWMVGWISVAIITSVALVFSERLHNTVWIGLIIGGIIFLAIFTWIVTRKSFHYKAFAIREHDIVYRTGWLIQSTRICPFNRIQHCSVDAGLIERQFGLASLSVFTAGGNEADMKIPGLPAERAADLRELIIQKTGTDGISI